MAVHSISKKVLSSKTIHDELCPLPRSSFRLIIDAFSFNSSAVKVIWANFVCLYRSLDKRSWESHKTKVNKASSGFVDILMWRSESTQITVILALLLENAQIIARQQDLRLGGTILYCFRRMQFWGRKLHAGYSILIRFYLVRSAICERCLEIRVRPYYNGYIIGRAAS